MPAGQPSPCLEEHSAPFSASTEITLLMQHWAASQAEQDAVLEVWGTKSQAVARKQSRVGICLFCRGIWYQRVPQLNSLPFLVRNRVHASFRTPNFYLDYMLHTVGRTDGTWIFESSKELLVFSRAGTVLTLWSPRSCTILFSLTLALLWSQHFLFPGHFSLPTDPLWFFAQSDPHGI